MCVWKHLRLQRNDCIFVHVTEVLDSEELRRMKYFFLYSLNILLNIGYVQCADFYIIDRLTSSTESEGINIFVTSKCT